MSNFFTMIYNAVKNNNGNNPGGFLVVFETVAIKVIGNVLPQTDISWCFFHLSSNLWKHIQRARLHERYMKDPQFGLQLRIIDVLAFVHPQDAINSSAELCVVIRNRYDGDALKSNSLLLRTISTACMIPCQRLIVHNLVFIDVVIGRSLGENSCSKSFYKIREVINE